MAEPLLGQVGADAAAVNNDKQTVAEAVVAAAVADGGFSSLHAAEKDGTAIVLMGHGTAHSAKVTYSQMQTMMRELGYKNVFIGTVEGEPEETACEEVIKAVHEAGYTKVILRPLMVVAGDHANNDMADPEDEESWFSMFTASGLFTDVQCQIAGLGRIETVQKLYVNHAQAAVYAMAPANETDAEAGARVGKLIDAIYVQQRTETTDAQCAAAKAAWDALTDAQKELVEGEEADPDYFGRDTGDAKLDDPLNKNGIGENELLVVSFGTSFNESRAEDIGGIEKALAAAFPEWAVRRAFTAQIIINHVQARDGEFIDNMDQAHGAEYDELVEAVTKYADKMNIVVAEPLLGQVGKDAAEVNTDKQTVAKAVVDAAVKAAGAESLEALEKDGTALVLMGHGTAHSAKVTYSQMQTQMKELGYKNVFIGTVEGEPEETALRGRHRSRQRRWLYQGHPAAPDGGGRRPRQQRHGGPRGRGVLAEPVQGLRKVRRHPVPDRRPRPDPRGPGPVRRAYPGGHRREGPEGGGGRRPRCGSGRRRLQGHLQDRQQHVPCERGP